MAPTLKDQLSSASPDRPASSLRDISEQAVRGGQSGMDSARDSMADAASQTAETLKDKGAALAEGAQSFASKVKDEFQDRIDAQKDVGADYVVRLSHAIRRAGQEFEEELPIAARYIDAAATTVNDYAEKFRSGNLNDLMEGTKAFAKRQPTAFLGLTFLAGFGLVRFLKSSSTLTAETEDESLTPSRRPQQTG